MKPLTALGKAGRTLRRNPFLFLIAFVYTAMGQASTVAQIIEPLFSIVALFIVLPILPFFLGGFIGLAAEKHPEKTGFQTFFTEGVSNYLSILVATVIVGLIFLMVTVIAFFISVVGGALLVAGGAFSGFIILALLMIPLYVIPWMFVQFYAVAIGVDDASMIYAPMRSGSVVSQNLLSVLGFTLCFIVISSIGQAPGAILNVFATSTGPAGETSIESPALFISSIGVSTVFGTLTLALTNTYLVTYYMSITEDDQETDTTPNVTTSQQADPRF